MTKSKDLRKIIIIAIFLSIVLTFYWNSYNFQNSESFENRENQFQSNKNNLKSEPFNKIPWINLYENLINNKDSIEESNEGEQGKKENQENNNAKSEEINNTVASLLLIGSVVAVAAYSYRLIKKKQAAKRISLEREKGLFKDGQKIKGPSQSFIQIFREENAIDKLSKLGDINITILPSDFLETVESLKWDENEKEEFVREMLSLKPSEREVILEKMVQKFNQKKEVFL